MPAGTASAFEKKLFQKYLWRDAFLKGGGVQLHPLFFLRKLVLQTKAIKIHLMLLAFRKGPGAPPTGLSERQRAPVESL